MRLLAKDALIVSNATTKVEGELHTLKAKADELNNHVVRLKGDLGSFQRKYGNF